ncbi:MAG: nickel pincer cofactor biosynthesis protein LarB [Gammaproteobacteria bacterium]|nr:nickel pincer cofactor biosynthesis protein LarB [Gammaproteobacteria bacterium]
MALDDILAAFKDGAIDSDEASRRIRASFYRNVGQGGGGHSTLDSDRLARTGASEVIYGAGKSAVEIAELVEALVEEGQNALVTRTTVEAYERVIERTAIARYHEAAAAITATVQEPAGVDALVAVITAGTSDAPVAEEAAVTAAFYGNPVLRVRDVGVSGLHRLLARLDEIRQARVVIVVAGMEGALPSVVGGLVEAPVISVPTSVGYGAAFGGVTALLGMLSSCAAGLAVVNIDNGFGAGYLAHKINRL